MFGVNPALIAMAAKGKLDEILNGQYPEGLNLKERTDKKIVLSISKDYLNDPGVILNSISVSIIYKGTEILLEND